MDVSQSLASQPPTLLDGRYLVEPDPVAGATVWKVRDLICPQCQRSNAPADQFCVACGHDLADSNMRLCQLDGARQKVMSALMQTLGEDAWPAALVGCRGIFQYLDKPCVLLDYLVDSGIPQWADAQQAVQNAVDVLECVAVLVENGFIPTLPTTLGRRGEVLALNPLALERASAAAGIQPPMVVAAAISALRSFAQQAMQLRLVELLDNAALNPSNAIDLLRDGLAVTQCPAGLRLVSGRVSSEGILRRGTPDEDSAVVVEMTRVFVAAPQSLGLYLVADGMGGHEAGEVASRMALEIISSMVLSNVAVPWLSAGAVELATAARLFGEAVEEAHRRIVRENTLGAPKDMGTTLNAALVIGDQLIVANVGDSRTYLYQGGPQTLSRFSHDQSLVQQMVDEGRLLPDDVYNDPRRNVILASLGSGTVSSGVQLSTGKLAPGDRVMLCSDGLWEMVRDPEIESVMKTVVDPQDCAERLIELACANGGEDNVTVLVVELQERKQM